MMKKLNIKFPAGNMNIHSAPSSPAKYKDVNSSFKQFRKTEEPSKQRLKLTHLQSTTPEIERPSSPAVSASVSKKETPVVEREKNDKVRFNFGNDFTRSNTLPKTQNPTITLLQKRRESQIPQGAQYLGERETLDGDKKVIDSFHVVPGSDLSKTDEFKVKNDLKSLRSPKSESFDEEFFEKRSKNLSNGHSSSPKRPPWENDDLPRTTWAVDTREIKYIGQKPLDESGLPFTLRSSVDEKEHKNWYKEVYKSLHKKEPKEELGNTEETDEKDDFFNNERDNNSLSNSFPKDNHSVDDDSESAKVCKVKGNRKDVER
ncbi:DgyrCDS11451 [Dimorphilus gyrociliatus]|uniref:DgyrCDS11451 n=1 Tax=Dimorphilus gyrociliatus TaxID=2664684 RepID=A0A7I8W5X1_9ANNE|nr:DgyrCDS11451 [Dimorphilus gyrociliatus]